MDMVSIIIPIYNAEKYLRECLDSALTQTLQEKEIICIDDGSTDSSYLILQEYQASHSQIKIVRQENKGAGEARNVGLEIARGKFVCFLDADDFYLDKTALEKMLFACHSHKVKVCGSFRKIKKNNCMELEKYELHRTICEGFPEGVLLDYLDYQDDYHYQNYIFDLEMIKKNGISFPAYRRYQDPPFFLRVMLVAKKMWVMPVELYCLRLGHQDFEQYEKLIKHTLMGIKDNMRLARDNHLQKLQKRIISRINYDFYRGIIDNFDNEIVMILMDINSCILENDEHLKVLDEIEGYYKLNAKYHRLIGQYQELIGQYQELSASYYIMRMLIETKYKGISIEDYLLNNCIKNIALYGLGTFGRALYCELKGSIINVMYGIDKRKCSLEGLCIVSKVDDIQEKESCDAIIVTPLKDGNIIANKLKKKVSIPIYTLIEILNEIEKTM